MPNTPPQFSFKNISENNEEIEIFPNRLLSLATLEKILNKISKIEEVISVTLQGQRLPKEEATCACEAENQVESRKILVQNQEIEIHIMTGRIILEVPSQETEKVIKKIKKISDQLFPFGYSIRVGKFLKRNVSLADYKREWFQNISKK